MGKTWDTQSVIELPGQLSAADLLTIGKQLITVARGEGKSLPRRIVKAVDRIEAAHYSLGTARLEPVPAPSTRPAYVASLEVGRRWSALHDFLGGFVKLGDDKRSPVAARLLDALLPSGLSWSRRKNKRMWGESESHAARLGQKQNAADLEALGAMPFVAAIEEAHRALGVELGVTARRAEPPAPAPVLDQAGELRGAMKSYIIQVVAHVDDDSAAAEPGARLLRPFEQWEDAPEKKAAPSEPPPAPAK